MITSIGTHNGKFHADEVAGVAVLKKIYPDAKVVRSRDPEVLKTLDIVIDVGEIYDHDQLRYDHHQNDFTMLRQNGIKYSSIGLVWLHYGREYLKLILDKADSETLEETWRRIDTRLVASLDADDNGQKTYEVNETGVDPIKLNDVVNWHNLEDVGVKEQDDQFLRISRLIGEFFEMRCRHVALTVAGEQEVLKAYQASDDKRFVILDQYRPVGELAEKLPELLYVAFPDSDGKSWVAKSIPKRRNSFDFRKPPPVSWRTKRDSELEKVTKILGSRYCHNSGLVFGAYSREAMLSLMTLAADA
jgi:uncharacterized UPF0160 family protein